MIALHRVMDSRAGDIEHRFDTKNADDVAAAMDRFHELVRTHTAARKTGEGTSEIVREFSPTDTEVLFYPRVVGG